MMEKYNEIDSELRSLSEGLELPERCVEIMNLCRTEIRSMNDSEKEEFNKFIEELRNNTGESQNDIEDTQVIENSETEAPSPEPPVEEEEVRSETNNINNINPNFINRKMEFRLLSALNAIANNRSLDDAAQAVNEAGAEELRKSGLNFNGSLTIPAELRAGELTVTTEGPDVVVTDFKDILAPLYAKNVLAQAGAKFMTGLVGDVQIPLMSAANVTWEGEIAPAGLAGTTFDSVKLQPKRITAYLPVSLQFLAQDSLGAENMIRQDLINAINAKLEATILSDNDGTSGGPVGLLYNATVANIAAFKDLTDIEAAVENAGIFGETKYIISPAAKSGLRNLAKSAKTTQLVMENGEVDGVPALSTGHMQTAACNIVYGDFSNLAIGQWGGIQLDVVRDSVSLRNGCVTIVVNAFFDAKVLRPTAFGYGKI